VFCGGGVSELKNVDEELGRKFRDVGRADWRRRSRLLRGVSGRSGHN
jgi:hypothetical protein